MRNYIDVSSICYQVIEEILNYKQNYINPVLSLLVNEEHKFYSISGKLLKKISNLQNRFDEINKENNQSDFMSYNPINYLKSSPAISALIDNSEFSEEKIKLQMQANLIACKKLFADERKTFEENYKNLELKSYVPSMLEQSKSLNDVSLSRQSNNLNKQQLSNKHNFNYESFNIDNFIDEKINETEPNLINETNNCNNNLNNNIEKNNNKVYKIYNNNVNLLSSNKIKTIPIKIPSPKQLEAINNKTNSNNANNNILKSNKPNSINNKLICIDNSELTTITRQVPCINEMKTKDTADSKASDSSYLSSSMLSDSIINEDANEHNKEYTINQTKNKKNNFSQKYKLNNKDYPRNYLKNNLLNDGRKAKIIEYISEKENEILYKSPEPNRKIYAKAQQKYKPKIITQEKIDNYYMDGFLHKPKQIKKEAENANKLTTLKASNSNSNCNLLKKRTNFAEKNFKEPSNQQDYEVNKQFKKSSSVNILNESKFDNKHKSKFQKKEEDLDIQYKKFYDENKENFKNADNVKCFNLPLRLNNHKVAVCNIDNQLTELDITKQFTNEKLNDKEIKSYSKNKDHYSSFINLKNKNNLVKNNKDKNDSDKNEKSKSESKTEMNEIQENLIVDVSESQGDNESKIENTEKNIKLKIDNNEHLLNESKAADPIFCNKSNQINQTEIANLVENNFEKNNLIIEAEKLIQDNFPKNCSEFKRLECWEEVSLSKQLSEAIKKKLFGKLNNIKNSEKSIDNIIESNVSNFSSENEDNKKVKNNLRKRSQSNATSSNKDEEREKRNACGKSQFENFYREFLSKENNNALIIYDVFNDKNDFGSDFFEDYYSDDNIANGNNNALNIGDTTINIGISHENNKEKEQIEHVMNNTIDMQVSELVEKIKDNTKKNFKEKENEE